MQKIVPKYLMFPPVTRSPLKSMQTKINEATTGTAHDIGDFSERKFCLLARKKGDTKINIKVIISACVEEKLNRFMGLSQPQSD
jgi:hypothetical protein